MGLVSYLHLHLLLLLSARIIMKDIYSLNSLNKSVTRNNLSKTAHAF